MKLSYSLNSDLAPKVFHLLDLVFPGLSTTAANARRLGGAWESISTPFVAYADEQLVAHVGVIPLTLILEGRRATVASVHAVATHPAYRRRGYYRAVMEEVLSYCANRYETLILTTAQPELYQPFGFRCVQEHIFTLNPPVLKQKHKLRLLDLETAADRALLGRLSESRTQVSNVVGIIEDKTVFFFNEGWRPLCYSEDLATLFCMELRGNTLHLFDLVAETLPSLSEVVACLPESIEQIIFYFSPERLTTEAQAVRGMLDPNDSSYLMVRGVWLAEEARFMLPRSART